MSRSARTALLKLYLARPRLFHHDALDTYERRGQRRDRGRRGLPHGPGEPVRATTPQ
ncbi:hypothetical protein [Amycolatopsis thermoflava]|uniref:hypothetical protein n=1 Tax=Amycolatopsis thermoflava TaxID=84480 RepID=UPI003EC111C5